MSRDAGFLLLLAATSLTPPPAPSAATFGALTKAGAGGVAVTGTAISSGDASGHWQIVGGFLSPSTAGDTAELNAGPYALVFDDASTLTVTVEANAWDVRTTADWDVVIVQSAATLLGKKIYLRPAANIVTGVDGTASRLRRNDYGGLIITSRDPLNPGLFDAFQLRGARNVTFDGLKRAPAAVIAFNLIAEAGANKIDGITIKNCQISGVVGDKNGDYSNPSVSYPNYNIDLIRTATAGTGPWPRENIVVTDNIIEWCANGITITATGGTSNKVCGNLIRYPYNDGINWAYGGADVPTDASDNVIMFPLGKATDTGNPHVDMIQFGGQPTATTDWTIDCHRNIIIHGDSRGDMQGIFADDMKTTGGGDSGFFFIARMTGNVVVGRTTHGLRVNQAKNCVILNNTVVADATSGLAYTIPIGIGESGTANATTSGTHRLERNIADAIAVGGTPSMTDNLVLGKGGATIPYATVFDGVDWATLTRAGVLAVFARKLGGPADLGGTYDAGAIGSGAVTFATASPGSDGVNIAT